MSSLPHQEKWNEFEMITEHLSWRKESSDRSAQVHAHDSLDASRTRVVCVLVDVVKVVMSSRM